MISAILLAAGQSKRMGGDNKLIKKYNKKYLINYIVGTLIKSKVDKIIIVLGFQSPKVRKITAKNEKINFIYNKNYKSGISSSIKVGLKRVSKKNRKEIIAPTYKGKMGKPIGFKYSMVKILNKVKKDSGAKKIILRNKKKLGLIKVISKSIFKDFNTKRDFFN